MNSARAIVTSHHPNPQNCKLKIRDTFFSRHSFGLNLGQAQLPLRQTGNETNKVLLHVNRGLEGFQSTVFPMGHRIKGLSFPGTN